MSEGVDISELSFKELIDYVKSTIGPLDLAEMLEIDVEKDKIVSPWNDADHTPSCHLYEDGFFDYSTGQFGDVIDLYMQLAGLQRTQAVRRLAEGASRIDADPGRVRQTSKEPPDLTDTFLACLQATDGLERWAEKLKPISAEWLGVQTLVFDGERMLIPHIDHEGKVRGIKSRGFDGRKTAIPGSTFMSCLYNPSPARLSGKVLWVVEGESDAWALDEHFHRRFGPTDGYRPLVVSLPCGAGAWKNDWLKPYKFDTLVLSFDNDRAGKQATEKVERSVRDLGLAPRVRSVPQIYNDVREALAVGWGPRTADLYTE
jgi:hypothetical protein